MLFCLPPVGWDNKYRKKKIGLTHMCFAKRVSHWQCIRVFSQLVGKIYEPHIGNKSIFVNFRFYHQFELSTRIRIVTVEKRQIQMQYSSARKFWFTTETECLHYVSLFCSKLIFSFFFFCFLAVIIQYLC